MASEQFLTVDDQPTLAQALKYLNPLESSLEILRQYIIEQELQTRDDLELRH